MTERTTVQGAFTGGGGGGRWKEEERRYLLRGRQLDRMPAGLFGGGYRRGKQPATRPRTHAAALFPSAPVEGHAGPGGGPPLQPGLS